MMGVVVKMKVASAGILCIALVGAGAAAGAAGAGDKNAAAAAAKPKNGSYKGKVGTFSRIAFTVKGNKAKKLGAGVNAACQDTFGTITRFMEVAVLKQQARIKKNGKISGKGMDANGTRWKIRGKFKSKRKAVGTFEASAFFLDPFSFTSELCAGSEKWSAKLK